MFLNEIFNTKVEVHWFETTKGYTGKFQLDGQSYEIHLEEYGVILPSGKHDMLDFAFTSNNKFDLTNRGSASRILGAVLNGAVDKIKSINPDLILFGAHEINSAVDSRIIIYDRLCSLYQRGSKFTYQSEWFKTPNGKYKFVSLFSPISEDLEEINKVVSSIRPK